MNMLKTYRIPRTDLDVSNIGYGCMTIGGSWKSSSPLTVEDRSKATRAVMTAYESGITLFDHADIYTAGKSESVFGEILNEHPGMREKIILQSKCGIRMADTPRPGDPFRYDFSRDHILNSVEGSLQRLQTDHLDILLLHRPDPLVEPEDVAAAFAKLYADGKVRYFGVSNHTAAQIELLQQAIDYPLVINQVELNLLHSSLIEEGALANTEGARFTASSGILDYCRLHRIMVQAWSPVAKGTLVHPPEHAEERIRNTASLVAKLAAEKKTSKEAILLGWLLRHPADIQPIIGTTNPDRISASVQANTIELTREEWYTLLSTIRGKHLP
ncbi:MAG TPA: aldo/keto reductase [Bacteroidota bacterium]|nr:aldo/keto reductase [Bacteroidota bacterium]